jgi:hypothetical protein
MKKKGTARHLTGRITNKYVLAYQVESLEREDIKEAFGVGLADISERGEKKANLYTSTFLSSLILH